MALHEFTSKSIYILPRDNFVGEVLIPSFCNSSSLDCMFGFFSSAALKSVAAGLAAYFQKPTEPIRLLIGPNISEEDAHALKEGVFTPRQVLEARMVELLGEAHLSTSAIVRHTLACLTYMLSVDLLHIRLVWLPAGSLFHSKVWFFREKENFLVAHGSSNLTASGLKGNHEQIRVDRSWDGPKACETIDSLHDEFLALWRGSRDYAVTLELPSALKHNLIHEYAPGHPPTLRDFRDAWVEDGEALQNLGLSPTKGRLEKCPKLDRIRMRREDSVQHLTMPQYLVLDDGPFAHQGRAIAAWEAKGRRGILSMATGSGKTVAALAAAARLQEEESSLLIVVSAPYKPLVAQWIEEGQKFGVKALSIEGNSTKRGLRLQSAIQRLKERQSNVEFQVVTNEFLTNLHFRQALDTLPSSVKSLLVADEVHSLGTQRFLSDPPTRFDFRLGLSATPQRQYDPEGTKALLDYFGPIAFEFALQEAIGVCLVPYKYHIHQVSLSIEEYEVWKKLTAQLRHLGILGDTDPTESGRLSTKAKRLLMARRLIVEAAHNKLQVLYNILRARNRDEIRHVLVYATDKKRAQLQSVNYILQDKLNLIVHEFTAKETASRKKSADLLARFAAGDYNVLTCMRVLDEGVDIPQVNEAFLLASNTVRRQWIQRRGRILRRSDTTQKHFAHLHDFLVVPPDLWEPEARAILVGELTRAREFATLSLNGGSPDGPFVVIEELMSYLFD